MNTFRSRSTALRGWISLAMATLMCASVAMPHAQNNQTKTKPAPAAASAKPAVALDKSTPPPPAATGRGRVDNASTGRGPTKKDPAKKDPAEQGQAKKDQAKKDQTKRDQERRDQTKGYETKTGAPPLLGHKTTQTPRGDEIERNSHNQVAEVRTRDGMVIHHGPGGSRTVTKELPGHVVVVVSRSGNGYIQRPYPYRDIVRRTYYHNRVAYARFYRSYVGRGIPLNVYFPARYYAPYFYGWAYSPWRAPVAYGWGWTGNPWYAYYGGYFAPYPAYSSPSFWLTDYLISQTLQAAYQEPAAELAGAPPVFTPIDPATKQAITEEVQRQIALENDEGSKGGAQTPPNPDSSGIARMLSDDDARVFVVSAGLDVRSGAGECSITEGDVLRLDPGTPTDATSANLVVLASKGQDCRKGSTVTVGIADLQDMQNHMRETLDEGLGELYKGQKGLPAIPAVAAQQPEQTVFAKIASPPDPYVATILKDLNQESEQAERDVLK